MKKLILFLCFMSFACSSSDSEPECFVYTARIETECANTNTSQNYTVSKSEYEYLQSQMNGSNPCVSVHFEDVNGTDVQGFLRGLSKTDC